VGKANQAASEMEFLLMCWLSTIIRAWNYVPAEIKIQITGKKYLGQTWEFLKIQPHVAPMKPHFHLDLTNVPLKLTQFNQSVQRQCIVEPPRLCFDSLVFNLQACIQVGEWIMGVITRMRTTDASMWFSWTSTATILKILLTWPLTLFWEGYKNICISIIYAKAKWTHKTVKDKPLRGHSATPHQPQAQLGSLGPSWKHLEALC
jgi:hypothetical protein